MSKTINANNERIKHAYFHYLKQADGKSDSTISHYDYAIRRYEQFTKFADFKTFDQRKAVALKEHLSNSDIALPTVLSIVNKLRSFFRWLSFQPGFKRNIRRNDIDYLRLSDRATRAAQTPAEKKFPTLQMIEEVVRSMHSDTAIEKRDRAMIALVALTGVRIGALISLKIKHLDLVQELLVQNPREVTTKARKPIYSFLLPLSVFLKQVLFDWVFFLTKELHCCDNDPLFPKTALGQDDLFQFVVNGLERQHWRTSAGPREIFKEAFRAVGFPDFTPHRFRDMIVSEMYKLNLTAEEFKAWSQNFGHSSPLTTFTSYGKISLERQRQLIRNIGRNGRLR